MCCRSEAKTNVYMSLMPLEDGEMPVAVHTVNEHNPYMCALDSTCVSLDMVVVVRCPVLRGQQSYDIVVVFQRML